MERERRAIAAGVLALALLSGPGCSRTTAKYPVLGTQGEVAEVSISGIAPGSGSFFSYRSPSGKTADLLVYRESSGRPRAVLDACRTCSGWKKGYRLAGDRVICIKCDMEFRLDALAEGVGSCVPIPLPSTVEGERLLIPVAALEAGTAYF